MTREELVRLRAVAEAATPGPWTHNSRPYGNEFESVQAPGRAVLYIRWEDDQLDDQDRDNAEHIATFDPPTVLRLLDMAERQAEALTMISEDCPGTRTEWHDGTKPCPHCASQSFASGVLQGLIAIRARKQR